MPLVLKVLQHAPLSTTQLKLKEPLMLRIYPHSRLYRELAALRSHLLLTREEVARKTKGLSAY